MKSVATCWCMSWLSQTSSSVRSTLGSSSAMLSEVNITSQIQLVDAP